MTQPSNKRFVMEDNLNTQLALKAPLANPTFTGTVSAPTLSVSGTATIATSNVSGTATTSNVRITNGSAATIASPTGFLIGTTSTFGLLVDPDSIQAAQSSAAGAFFLNPEGGDVTVGSASATTSVLGTFTPPRGYLLVDRLEYTTSPANFTKATYPWLRAIRVICVGAGGGGGGAALTAAGQNAIGQAGAGGAYAETFITNIAGLAASEVLTVGTAGTAGGAGAAGGAGGDTSFGTFCVAKGGTAGGAGAAAAVGVFAAGVSGVAAASSTGDIIYPGTASSIRQYAYNASVIRPVPGGSTVSPGPLSTGGVITTTSAGTTPGTSIYGVGGYPGVNAQSQAAAVAGGAGSGGIMIVELYA